MPLIPKTLADRFCRTTLAGQYILCRDAAVIPDGWPVFGCCAGWILGAHPRLPVVSLADGWMLGHWVKVDGEHVGRYVTIRPSVIELDAAGRLPAFYCPSQQIVASSPMLIPYTPETEDNTALIEALDIFSMPVAFYPFGTTPRHGIHRLLPNHHLDLDTWQSNRDWPTEPIARIENTLSAVAAIASLLRETFEKVSADGATLSLTAGRDSRMLLACARSVAKKLDFATTKLPDVTAATDVKIAKQITRRFGLKHRVNIPMKATQEQIDRWLYRTGCAVSSRRGMMAAPGTHKESTDGHWHVNGLVAEVGRAFYWKNQPGELMEKMKLPEMLESAAQRWRDALPVDDQRDVLDIAYLEQRVSCWSGTASLARNASIMSPFANRRIIRLMLSVPHEYRRQQRLAVDVIEHEWPELLRWPFNPKSSVRARVRNVLNRTPYFWRLSRFLR